MNKNLSQSLTVVTEVPVVPEIMEEEQTKDLHSVVITVANAKQFHIFLPTFILICILLALGAPGNICALVVYITRMKQAVARQFLITLATCDLLTCLVVMPTELDIMNRFFLWDMRWTCKSIRWFAYMINNLANFTLLAIAIERYRLVCKPWKQKLTPCIKVKICFMNAFFATVTALPMFFIYGSQNILLYKSPRSETNVTDEYSIDSNSTVSNGSDVISTSVYGTSCLMDDEMATSKFPFYIVAFYIVCIVITFFVLIFLYGNVLKTLVLRRKQSLSQKQEKIQRDSTSRIRKVTLMMVVLTALYEICYLPCLVTVCIRLIYPDVYVTLSEPGKIIFQLMLKSYLLCSAINPFVYGFCNKEFTSELIKLSRSVLPKKQKIDRYPQSSRTKIVETEDLM